MEDIDEITNNMTYYLIKVVNLIKKKERDKRKMVIVAYTEGNIEKIYLSPYTEIG